MARRTPHGNDAGGKGTGAAGYLIGFGLGGFFDGILLHQILQWHHLLSAVDAVRGDLRLLILWDGLFHLAMYLITGLGLWGLWRHRQRLATAGGDRRLIAQSLLGFGSWHAVDALFSHWLFGLHRIRMGVDNPLAWDLGWLLLFGLLPALVGWRLLRGPAPPAAGSRRGAAFLAMLALLAAPIAARSPDSASGATLMLLRPGTSPGMAAAGLQASGARLLWSNAQDTVWAVDLPEGADRGVLYRHGALLLGNGLLPAGCLDWFAPPAT
ncbi:DUF2243 domain-containing protein [Rhizobium sp. CSW-27]|uniref:DUF2243 domain-containing protein n=1 Tax=Rhizobium sp. CSW-27 TaxID=2839985 RepID=UPI001C03644D|nr:DUF2243 domain-containing protein [Rhizobium sp. CSW-27]MBT9368691.1 DUF2243 domain-containing protein [Rhizobium sp. CSW-27]